MPFGGFLVELVALSVLMTWIFNATGGSVLVSMLVHGSIILASLFLPAGLPVATHDLLAFWISVGLGVCAVAGLLAMIGPRLGNRGGERPEAQRAGVWRRFAPEAEPRCSTNQSPARRATSSSAPGSSNR